MEIESLSAKTATSQAGVAVAKKELDVGRQQGEVAKQLIDGAGEATSKVNKPGVGQHLNVIA